MSSDFPTFCIFASFSFWTQDVSVLIMIGRESFNVTFVTDDDQRFGVHKCMHSFQTDSLKWMLWTSLPDYFSHCILIYCQAQAKLQLQLAWVEPYSQCFSPPTHPTGKVLNRLAECCSSTKLPVKIYSQILTIDNKIQQKLTKFNKS